MDHCDETSSKYGKYSVLGENGIDPPCYHQSSIAKKHVPIEKSRPCHSDSMVTVEERRHGSLGEGDTTRETQNAITKASHMVDGALLGFLSRIPRGYTTLEEASLTFSDLLRMSREADEKSPQSTNDGPTARNITRTRNLIQGDARRIPFPATDPGCQMRKVKRSFRLMEKKVKKQIKLLNRELIFLIQRQTKILHLRMSIVDAMMGHKSTLNMLERKRNTIEHSEVMSSDNKMNASWSSIHFNNDEISAVSNENLSASWPQLTTTEEVQWKQEKIDQWLSLDINTIHEGREDDSSECDIPVSPDQPTAKLTPESFIDRWAVFPTNAPPLSSENGAEPNSGRLLLFPRRQASFPRGDDDRLSFSPPSKPSNRVFTACIEQNL